MFDDAISQFETAIGLGLNSFSVYYQLSKACEKIGDYPNALQAIKQAILADATNSDAFNHLGTIYLSLGEWASAKPCFEKAIQLNKNSVPLSNLAVTLMMLNQSAGAIEVIKESLQIDPSDANAHNTLGNIYMERGDILNALDCFNSATTIDPDFAEAHNHKGGALLRLRQIKDAIKSYERAISINPMNIEALNNRNLALNYDNSYSDTQIFQKHSEFGKIFDQPLARFQRQPRPKEKLRIGYVSADFRQHSVNYFFEPVLRNHNKTIVEIYCYHNSNIEDSVTKKLKEFADHWRPIKNLSDEQAAQLITDDEIDVLVDLSGHTNGSRLAVFGLKPAPIQCTWLGYPNTTGLTTIDYRLTDELTDPSDAPDVNYTETLYRIDGGFSCYQGDHAAEPANKIGGSKPSPNITFGCFN
ncbi:MAG: tetratricopeptide repeat protein, partial [Opitutae bacterium]